MGGRRNTQQWTGYNNGMRQEKREWRRLVKKDERYLRYLGLYIYVIVEITGIGPEAPDFK